MHTNMKKQLELRTRCAYGAHRTDSMTKNKTLTAHNLTLDPRITALADVYVKTPGSRWRSKSELANALLVKFLRSKKVKVPIDYVS